MIQLSGWELFNNDCQELKCFLLLIVWLVFIFNLFWCYFSTWWASVKISTFKVKLKGNSDFECKFCDWCSRSVFLVWQQLFHRCSREEYFVVTFLIHCMHICPACRASSGEEVEELCCVHYVCWYGGSCGNILHTQTAHPVCRHDEPPLVGRTVSQESCGCKWSISPRGRCLHEGSQGESVANQRWPCVPVVVQEQSSLEHVTWFI